MCCAFIGLQTWEFPGGYLKLDSIHGEQRDGRKKLTIPDC